jgi:outer membrane protein TolC
MRHFMLIGALALFTAPGAAAQSPTDTVRLTLDAAVQRALDQGAEMRVARAVVLDAGGQVREALSAALPQVNGSLTYTRQFASIYQGAAGGDTSSISKLFKNTPFGAPNAYNLQLQATQLLWAGGKVGAALSAARSFEHAASFQQSETAAEITLRVKETYWDAVLQGQLVMIAVKNLDVARQHLREVQLYQEAGTRAEYDVLRAQVDAANQEPLVVQARNGYDVATLQLKRLLNVPAEQPMVLETALESADETIPVLAADSVGAPDRAGLAAAEATVREQESLVKVARADRWPTLSVTTTYNEQTFPADGSPIGADYVHGWNGEVRLAFPIFTGFRTGARVQQAHAALERARADRDNLRQQVQLQVVGAQGELERARALLVARRQTTRQALRALHLSEVRYTNGMATQLDISDTRVAAAQAAVNQVQATRDYVVALAQLERALGHPVPVVRRPIEQVAEIPNVKEAQP